MPDQAAKLIKAIACDHGIDLDNASIEKHLYIYALTFKEIQVRLSGDLINFPIESLQEIIDAFKYAFSAFNDLLNKPIQQILYNDISNVRASLIRALACSSAAMTMQKNLVPNSPAQFQVLETYYQHLYTCQTHVVNINSQIAEWLKSG